MVGRKLCKIPEIHPDHRDETIRSSFLQKECKVGEGSQRVKSGRVSFAFESEIFEEVINICFIVIFKMIL